VGQAPTARSEVAGAQEIVYRDELADAVRQFLAFVPEHSELSDEIAFEAATWTAVVGAAGSGGPEPCRWMSGSLGGAGLIRHCCTSYENDLFDASTEDPWDEDVSYREIKADAQRTVDDSLHQHRNQESGLSDKDRLGTGPSDLQAFLPHTVANHSGCSKPVNSHPDDATVCGRNALIAR